MIDGKAPAVPARVDPAAAAGAAGRPASYAAIVLRQFLRHRAAVLGLVMVMLFCVTASVATYIAPYPPAVISLGHRLEWPSGGHWLGTDELGRDALSRLLVGSRTTLLITTGAVALAVPVGTALGLAAGYFGGAADSLISRLIDVLMALPGFLL